MRATNPRRFRFHARKFLNYDGFHGNATICCYVEKGNKKSKRNPLVHLTISDCSHEISLEFGVYNENERRNSLHKATVLVDTLTKFRDALQVELAALEPAPVEDEEDYF